MNDRFYREWLPRIAEVTQSWRELILTNAVMINEEPAPTFSEAGRGQIFLDRLHLAEKVLPSGLDERNNGIGVWPGSRGDRGIAVVSRLDTADLARPQTHMVSIGPDWIRGAGLADSGLAAAVNASLPFLLEKLDYQPKANLIFIGSSQSLGSADLGGLRTFLQRGRPNISYGICLQGMELGRLSHTSPGGLRGRITYRAPEGTGGDILRDLREMMDDMGAHPLHQTPQTNLSLLSIRAGDGFQRTGEGCLHVEIGGTDPGLIEELARYIQDLSSEYSARTGAEIEFETLSRRIPGGLADSPLVRHALGVLGALDIPAETRPSGSELSAFVARDIPALTLGLARAAVPDRPGERIPLTSLYRGVTQVLALLIKLDQEIGDE